MNYTQLLVLLTAAVSAMLCIAECSRDKGMSSMPYYGGGGGYGGYSQQVSYLPTYQTQAYAVDSYGIDLPQYSFKNNFKTYMPVVKYLPVQSVPYQGPTMAFYPSYYPSYGKGQMMGGYY